MQVRSCHSTLNMSLLSLLKSFGQLKTMRHLSRKDRIRFYMEIMYNWATSMHCIPFEYKFATNSPQVIYLHTNRKSRTLFGATSFFSNLQLIIYLNFTILFCKVSQFETLYVVGVSFAFVGTAACELFTLLPQTQSLGISVMNSMLVDYSEARQSSSRFYELTCLTATIVALIFPFLYYPAVLGCSWYIPGVLVPLQHATGLVSMLICFGNERMAHVAALCCYYGYLTAISTSLGHAVVNTMVVFHWISTYLTTTNAVLQSLNQAVLQRCNMSAESEYARINVLFKAFMHTFSPLISTMFLLAILTIIALTYLLLQRDPLPLILIVPLITADVGAIVIVHSLLAFITSTHLSSEYLVGNGRNKVNFHSGYRLKFWEGTMPLQISFGGVCSCETSEFVLIIWLDVILKTIIDLLMTF